MSVAESFNPANINLSARAAQKVRDLVAEEENVDLKLRVFIRNWKQIEYQRFISG